MAPNTTHSHCKLGDVRRNAVALHGVVLDVIAELPQQDTSSVVVGLNVGLGLAGLPAQRPKPTRAKVAN